MNNFKKLCTLTLIFLLITTSLAVKKKKRDLRNSTHIQSIPMRSFEKMWLKPMVKSIINSTRPCLAIIWALDMAKLIGQFANLVNREFSEYLPTLQLDKRRLYEIQDNRIMELQIIKYPRKTLNVILVDEESPDFLGKKNENHLYWIIRTSPVWPRSNTLLIIIGSGKNPLISRTVDKLLKLAWTNKFVDFSVVYVHQDLNLLPEVSYYKMFDKEIKTQKLTANITIFPQKLKNLKGHEFVVDLEKKRLDWEEKKVKSFNLVFMSSLYPSDYAFAKYFFCYLRNCTFIAKPVKEQTPDMLYSLKRSDSKSSNTYASDSCYRFLVIFPAIPHHTKFTTTLSYDNLIFAYSLFITIMVVLKLTVIIFKLNRRYWNLENMYSCILGFSINLNHGGFRNRVFYLSLVFWSFCVSNGLLELATEFELETTKESINNIDELMRLHLPLFSNYRLNRLIKDDKLGENFIYTFENKSTIYECFSNMSLKNDRICIGNEYVFNLASSRSIKLIDKGHRRAAFNLAQVCETYQFQAGLAYAAEYYKLVLRALDHGFLRRLTLKQECKLKKIDYTDQDYDVIGNDPSAFYWSLLVVTSFVYVVAVITFLCEISIRKFHTKNVIAI